MAKKLGKKGRIAAWILGIVAALLVAALATGAIVWHNLFKNVDHIDDSMEILESIEEQSEDPEEYSNWDDSDDEWDESIPDIEESWIEDDSELIEESDTESSKSSSSGVTSLNNWQPMDDKVYNDPDTTNILLVGVDSRKNNYYGRSDSMIVASFNKRTQTITLTSFMRDTLVDIPGKGLNRLNAAKAFGGMPLLKKTLEHNFGIHIDYYVMVNFVGFAKVVDMLGGVDMWLSKAEAKWCGITTITVPDGDSRIPEEESEVESSEPESKPEESKPEQESSTPEEESKVESVTPQESDIPEAFLDEWWAMDQTIPFPDEGATVHLNGTQTVLYCRIRKIGNSDYQRTERQRNTLTKLINKAKRMSLSQIKSIAAAAMSSCSTDMSEGEMLSFVVTCMTDYKNYKIESYRIPIPKGYKGSRYKGMSILSLDFEKNIAAFNEKVYGIGAE